MSKIVMFDVDPATVEMRSRDTEHQGAGSHDPGPWSEWAPLPTDASIPPEYAVAYLAASQLPSVGMGRGSVTIVLDFADPSGAPLRTIDCQLRTKAAA